jgi:hypothetical protein
MTGSMIISLHLAKKIHEGAHIPKFDDQNGFKVLGNTIKSDSRPSEIE